MSVPSITATEDAADADLVRRAQRGDGEACEVLARRYRQSCFVFALQLMGNREDARDVAQDALVRFLTTLERFDAGRPVLPWLRRIVRNRAFDLMRRQRVRRSDSLDSDGPRGEGIEIRDRTTPSPQLLAERRALRAEIWRALRKLTPRQREIVVLRDYQDLSYREMAETLDIPIGTVMSRLHGARRQLRSLLHAETSASDGEPR